jgi:hypothetical protein
LSNAIKGTPVSAVLQLKQAFSAVCPVLLSGRRQYDEAALCKHVETNEKGVLFS